MLQQVVVHPMQICDVVPAWDRVPGIVGVPTKDIDPKPLNTGKIENNREPLDSNISEVCTAKVLPSKFRNLVSLKHGLQTNFALRRKLSGRADQCDRTIPSDVMVRFVGKSVNFKYRFYAPVKVAR